MSDWDFAAQQVRQLVADAALLASVWEEEMQLDVVVELARSTRGQES